MMPMSIRVHCSPEKSNARRVTMARKSFKFIPQRTFRYYYLRFLRLQDNPRVLARGVAIGLFIGGTPTMPFHTVLTLLLAVILRGSKFAALIAGFVITNPLTVFPVYFLCWWLGSFLTGSDISWEQINRVLSFIHEGGGIRETLFMVGKLSQEAVLVMMVGGVTLAAPVAFLGYILSLRFFTALHEKRQKKAMVKQDDR
jgi:uncharacterized protein